MVWRSWVRTPARSNLGHAVLKFVRVALELKLDCYSCKQLLKDSSLSFKPPQEARHNFPKGDYAKLAGMLSDENREELESLDALNSWQYLDDKINTAMSDSISLKPQHTGTKKQKPLWMNETALKKNLKRNVKYIKETYILEKEQPTWKYCKTRNQAKSCCKKALREFEKSIANEAKSNPNAFYAYARSKLKTKSGIADLEDGNKFARSNEDKATTLNNFFCSVFTKQNLENIPTF